MLSKKFKNKIKTKIKKKILSKKGGQRNKLPRKALTEYNLNTYAEQMPRKALTESNLNIYAEHTKWKKYNLIKKMPKIVLKSGTILNKAFDPCTGDGTGVGMISYHKYLISKHNDFTHKDLSLIHI